METQQKEQKIKREIKKLESFLKTVNAKYEVNEDEVVVYGEIGESIFLNPYEVKGETYNVDIKINVKNVINIYFYKGLFRFTGFKNNIYIQKTIRRINYIVTSKNKLYIVF